MLVLFIGMLITGCGVWTDFTTYFNLYYNTKVFLEKAELEIEAQPRDIFQFREEKVPPTANTNLTKVIEKCSNILQFNSQSSFVDDALFMIGKAFYYQESYSRAIRKFLELLSQEENSLTLEAELWLGKSKLQMREFDEGLEILSSVKEKALLAEDDVIFNEASIRQISYWIYREEYNNAIAMCNELIAATNDDRLISETLFKLGDLYVKMENYESALKSYNLVNDYSPSFELELDSQIQAARVNYDIGRNEASLEILQDLFNEDKFEDNLDFIQLEMGLNYYKLNRIEEAKNIFIVVDSSYSQSEAIGIADYSLGKLWEFKLVNYDSAKFYYKLATISPAPIEYKDSAKTKMEIFDRYFFLKSQYNNNNKRYYYSMNPEEYVKDSIAHAEYLVRLNDYLEEKRLEEEANNPNRIPTNLGMNTDQVSGIGQNEETVGQATTVAARRNTPQTPVANSRGLSARDRLRGDELPEGLVEVPEPPINRLAPDSLKSLISQKELELGNLFFTDFEVPDSAEAYYLKIVRGDSTQRLYPNALFALGSLYQTLGRDSEADSLFQVIYDEYSLSTVYIEAAKKLGLIEEENSFDPSEDLYVAAEDLYYNSERDSAIAGFYEIVNLHPSSEYAPKALYTIGFILENEMMLLDSAASVYASLAEMYGSSKYAKDINGKLGVYTAEKKVVVKDSLNIKAGTNLQNSVVPDSLNVTVPTTTSNLDSTRFNNALEIEKLKQLRDEEKLKSDAKLKDQRVRHIEEEDDTPIKKKSGIEPSNMKKNFNDSLKVNLPDSTSRLDSSRFNNAKVVEEILQMKELEKSEGEKKALLDHEIEINNPSGRDSIPSVILPEKESEAEKP